MLLQLTYDHMTREVRQSVLRLEHPNVSELKHEEAPTWVSQFTTGLC